jgi:hypothetical protein
VKRIPLYILLLVVFFSLQCGTDYIEEGKNAFNNGDYTQAIKSLSLAQKEDSTNRSYDEIICLAYLYRGDELFKKTRNVDAFQGNFDQAQKYIPENPTLDFKRKYSEMQIALANAYLTARAKNEEEKEFFFEEAVDNVRMVMEMDSSNTAAESLMVKLKEDHFQNLIDKGESFYKKAHRNPDLYYTAEYYFKEALKFEVDNKEILNYLHKIKQKTLPVLNYREGVSMAVASYQPERKAMIVKMSIKNYQSTPLKLNLDNFKLVDAAGNEYGVNRDEMKKYELFGESCIKDILLNAKNPSSTGIVAFNAPADIKIASIKYRINSKRSVKKVFP